MVYTIFNTLTGKIIKISNCPISLIKLQLNEFEDYIEGSYFDTEYCIENRIPMRLLKKENDKKDLISSFLTKEEELIRDKQVKLIRQQAIKELKEEGKLPKDYKE
jgi:hypothetical protein